MEEYTNQGKKFALSLIKKQKGRLIENADEAGYAELINDLYFSPYINLSKKNKIWAHYFKDKSNKLSVSINKLEKLFK